MQMVAAAKLRRAQTAAEAARPYAERMEAVLANLAKALEGREGGPRLMVGTGKDKVHLLVVCTSERGLCGGFNSAIVRLAREHINRILADGNEVKILCVGKKGYDQLRRQYQGLIIDTIEFRGVRQLTFEHAEQVSRKVLSLFDEGGFDIATLFFSRFKSVISQIPTAQQIIPASIRRRAKRVWISGAPSTNTSRTKTKF
jgi:F-type H+-transporting ATPase subunit gamma